MKKHTCFIYSCVALLLAAALFSGCGSSSGKSAVTASYNYADSVYEDDGFMYESAAEPRLMKTAMVQSSEDSAAASSAAESASYERKLIKNGSISLEVKDLDAAEEGVTAWCASWGGYVSSSNSRKNSRSITLRLPSDRFDEAMNSFGTLGIIQNRSISTNDVTDQFYDLESRIQTKQILYDRLSSYLESAENMTDLISIESELNVVQSDLESMVGQMKRLSDRISFSTINVYLELPASQNEAHYQTDTLGSRLADLFAGFGEFIQIVVVLLVGLVVFGIPLVLIVALLYYLLFGKVGLIKRLFRRLHK